MGFILSMLRPGATKYRTRNQVQIICVIKCNQFSQVTSVTHLRSSLYYSMDFILSMLRWGYRIYKTKSGANCLCDKMQSVCQVALATHFCSSLYCSMGFILSMLRPGATEYRTRNQVQIICVIKCNQFSQVTYLAYPFITA